MSKRLICLLAVANVAARNAHAFDPFTIAMGAQSAGNMMGILGQADELVDTGFAFSELLSELEIESGSEDEMRKASNRISEMQSKAQELNWSREDLHRALSSDLQKTNNLSAKIRSLRNMIAASKKIAAIIGLRSKAGEKAVHIQQININSMMLEELQGIRREQFLSMLSQRQAEAKRDIYVQQIVEQETGRRSASKKQRPPL